LRLLRLLHRLRLLRLLCKSVTDLKHIEHRQTTRIKVWVSCKATQVIQTEDLLNLENGHDLIGTAWMNCSVVQQPLAQERAFGRHVRDRAGRCEHQHRPTKSWWRRQNSDGDGEAQGHPTPPMYRYRFVPVTLN
jgi:hypothetical protein